MATPRLTEGAISMITTDSAVDLKPTLQVTELKQVPTKQPNSNNNDRYRMVLSDGIHSQQAMLATQINHLVKDGHLRSGSVVQLIQYQCAQVQGRKIIIVLLLTVIVEECALIGNPVRSLPSGQPMMDQPRNSTLQPASGSHTSSTVINSNASISPSSNGSNQFQHGSHSSGYVGSTMASHTNAEPVGFSVNASTGAFHTNQNTGTYNSRPVVSHPNPGAYSYPPQSTYKQPPPMYPNRGPVTKNEAAPRIIPISALNPYQGRWTIKARVTAKGEMRHYNNPRGDGKVFSFDLLDSGRGEIRVTCFNAVADQFYNQIETGRVYLISKGSLKPAQKNFNHLRNDLEIFLENQSVIQPCFEDDNSIPHQQFNFRPISDIENMDNNAVLDVTGVVFSVTPTVSIMRKNGTETQKRTLQLKDMSGRSVELTLWGNFCHVEGQRLQSICDSGGFPVIAVKSGRVNDFNGKSLGTISSSQLLIDPDFPETGQLREWYSREGRATPSVSMSKEVSGVARSDSLKTISRIKDEKLGTSEKPDWISVNATIIFIKSDNFCYTACPIMIGDRPCNKKVTNNGDGKWRCERCDQSVDECDYRYILQFQIQDHTGLTWVTAFQESGEEIMGMSAKDLHFMKHENQDEEGFAKVLRQVSFARYIFKLKVKEETFSDESRVKSTVVKAEKLDHSTNSRFLLSQLDKLTSDDGTSTSIPETGVYHTSSLEGGGYSSFGNNRPGVVSNGGNESFAKLESRMPSNHVERFGNQYSQFPASSADMICSSCGATGHSSSTCPSITPVPGRSLGEPYSTLEAPATGYGSSSGKCYKCHQVGHWARDCPGMSSGPPPYGGSGMSSRRFG